MAKIKIERDNLTPSSSTLCCKINPQIKCLNCQVVMCFDCGKKWSGRKHFIIDLCRRRFSAKELKEATECFKKRIGKEGSMPKRFGNCTVCRFRRRSRFVDRAYTIDRLSQWPNL